MFDGYYNIQLGGELMKINYPKLTVMIGVEHTVSLFFNDVSNIFETTNLRGTRQPDNLLKGIRNPIPRNLYNIIPEGAKILHQPHTHNS